MTGGRVGGPAHDAQLQKDNLTSTKIFGEASDQPSPIKMELDSGDSESSRGVCRVRVS